MTIVYRELHVFYWIKVGRIPEVQESSLGLQY